MSLHLYCEVEGEELLLGNMTHNLANMAKEVEFFYRQKKYNLYEVLWKGDQYKIGNTLDIRNILIVAIPLIIENKTHLELFNPENGWGSYDGLLKFCQELLLHCVQFGEKPYKVIYSV